MIGGLIWWPRETVKGEIFLEFPVLVSELGLFLGYYRECFTKTGYFRLELSEVGFFAFSMGPLCLSIVG